MKSHTAYIIGGGPSALKEPLGLLQNQEVIGTNAAYVFRCVNAVVMGDYDFIVNHQEALRRLKDATLIGFDDVVTQILPRSIYYPKMDCKGLYSGQGVSWFFNGNNLYGNTGAGAINLAALWGFTRIVLIGFDFNENVNWHQMHPGVKEGNPHNKFMLRITSFKPDLDRLGIEVLNTSMDSALKCFEKVELKKLL